MDTFLGQSPTGLPFMVEEAVKALALRTGDWKYIEHQSKKYGIKPAPPELYNLRTDPSETNNLIQEYPKKANAMAVQLQSIVQSKGIRTSATRLQSMTTTQGPFTKRY